MKKTKIILFLITLFIFLGCKKHVRYSPEFIQKKLVGSWTGTGHAHFSEDIDWTADFKFESDGRYTGVVTSVQNGMITSVFNNGDDNLTSPEKKLIIQSIDVSSNAQGVVRFVHENGHIMEYQIEDLAFSNKYKNLEFTVSWGAKMTYSLKRN